MKTSAIFRIIAFSIVALILLSILTASIAGTYLWRGIFSNIRIPTIPLSIGPLYRNDDNELYTSGPASVSADGIERINIDWVAGEVVIKPSSGEEISFSETAGSIPSPREQMRWRVSGNTLSIDYCDSGFNLLSLRGILNHGKDLTVEIPSGLYLRLLEISSASADISIGSTSADSLDVETASGSISVSDADYSEMNIDNVSGKIEFSRVAADRSDINTVSGSITLQGDFSRLDIEGVSGNVTVKTETLPSAIDITTVSGRTRLTIPENNGFSASFSTVSGKLDCDFPLSSKSGRQIYQGGGPEFEFESVSGSVSIQKGN